VLLISGIHATTAPRHGVHGRTPARLSTVVVVLVVPARTVATAAAGTARAAPVPAALLANAVHDDAGVVAAWRAAAAHRSVRVREATAGVVGRYLASAAAAATRFARVASAGRSSVRSRVRVLVWAVAITLVFGFTCNTHDTLSQ
jgi:hypothetical protein